MNTFKPSLFVGLAFANLVWFIAVFIGNVSLLIVVSVVGLIATFGTWLVLDTLNNQSARLQPLYMDISSLGQTAVISPATYIQGQRAIIITSGAIGIIFMVALPSLSLTIKNQSWIMSNDSTRYALLLLMLPILLTLLLGISHLQFQKGLFGAYVIRTSLRVASYLMTIIGISAIMYLAVTFYLSDRWFFIFDTILLIAFCWMQAMVIGITHAVCWDRLGLHPHKHTEQFSAEAIWLACENNTLPFSQQINIFWQGIWLASEFGLSVPMFIVSFIPNLTAETALGVWVLSFFVCFIGFSIFHYQRFLRTPIIRNRGYMRLITEDGGQTRLLDIETKQTFWIHPQDAQQIERGYLYDIWYVQPFNVPHVVGVRRVSNGRHINQQHMVSQWRSPFRQRSFTTTVNKGEAHSITRNTQ